MPTKQINVPRSMAQELNRIQKRIEELTPLAQELESLKKTRNALALPLFDERTDIYTGQYIIKHRIVSKNAYTVPAYSYDSFTVKKQPSDTVSLFPKKRAFVG